MAGMFLSFCGCFFYAMKIENSINMDACIQIMALEQAQFERMSKFIRRKRHATLSLHDEKIIFFFFYSKA